MERRTILLAEDEADDVFMMQRAVQKMDLPVTLHVVKDGQEAIDYLAGHRQYANRELYPLPSLILLDIKMPRKDGFDVLEWLKKDGRFTQVPTVIVTSSTVAIDMDKARQLGARAYLVKPVALEELQQLFAATDEYLSVHH